MPDIIKDGGGTGFLAKVNKENQLISKSVSVSNIHYRSLKGDAYIIPFYYKQISGDTDAYAGVVTYTGTRILIGAQIHVSTQEAFITQVSIYGGSVTSGGYPIAPINLNTMSSKTLPATCVMQADGAVPITTVGDGGMLFQINTAGGIGALLDAQDSLIVRPNLPIAVKIKATTTNSLVRCYITCYEMDEF